MPLKLLGPASDYGDSALSAPPDVVMQRAREAVEEKTGGGGLKLLGRADELVPAGGAGAENVTDVPKGFVPPSRDALLAEARAVHDKLTAPLPLSEERTTLGNILQSHATKVADYGLATPSVIADLVRKGGVLPGDALGRTAANWVTGQPDEPLGGATPRVETADIAAGIKSLTSDKTMEEARSDIDAAEAQRRENYPLSSSVGDVTGIAHSFGMGKSPFIRSLRKGEVDLERRIASGRPMSQVPMVDRAAWKKALQRSVGFPSAQKVFSRGGEAFGEGAAIALLEKGDPLETAAYTGGAQLVLGGALQAAQHKFLPFKNAGRVANLAINTSILSSLFYAIDVAMPGPAKDYEAQKAATQKLLWGYGIGLGTSLLSGRARSGMFSASVPGGKAGHSAADALTSVPRHGMQSMLADYAGADKEKRANIKAKVTTFYENLDKVPEQELRGVMAALKSGNKDRFYKELDRVTKGLGAAQ